MAPIRTEGDSFYVVFASVAEAVRAGLAILAAVGRSDNHAGRFAIFPGGEGCEPSHRALEDWAFGESTGLLLCYTSSDGDAIIEWGYDDADVLARAVRHDGDMAALLGWWTDNARFGP